MTAEEIARRRAEAIANIPPRTVSSSESSPVMIAECQAEETEAYEPSRSGEFPRKPDIQYNPNIAVRLDAVGRIGRPPRQKVKWKKPRSAKQKPEPLVADRLEYLRIFLCHHRNPDYTWSEIAILSEIDFFVGDRKKPCFASIKHFASVGRVCPGTAKNILKKLEADGVVFTMGYHGATKDRVVTPAHSHIPEVSQRIIDEFRAKRDIPF